MSSPSACVRRMTAAASSDRPLATSQRGDSGITVNDSTTSTNGSSAPQPTITRQFTLGGRSSKAQLATKPSMMPKLMASSDQVVSLPR